jgi:hypothetical protein
MRTPITIGCQVGGPEDCVIGSMKVSLFHALEKHVTSTQCEAIDEYSLILRVDGTLQKFGEEGNAFMRFAKKSRYITVDIQIPEVIWQNKTTNEMRIYLAQVVRNAIVECVDYLKKKKCSVSDKQLLSEVDIAISEFVAGK